MNSSRTDRRIARTRSALMHAFVQLFLEKPYSQITIGEIADRADVGRSTLYEHYRSKDAMLAESFRHPLAPLATLVEANAPTSAAISALEHFWSNRDRARWVTTTAARRAMTQVLADFFEPHFTGNSAQRRIHARAAAEACIGLLFAWLAGEFAATPKSFAATLSDIVRKLV